MDGVRETNHRSTTTWIRRVLGGQSPVAEREILTDEQRARERLVFQMRMIDGVQRSRFRQQTGFDVEQLAGSEIRSLVAHGLLDQQGGRLRLTRKGLLVSDAIWPHFLLPPS